MNEKDNISDYLVYQNQNLILFLSPKMHWTV